MGVTTVDASADHVVLLDPDGAPIGSSPRTEVHTADTPLHLAFSLYLFNDAGEVLLTRRALQKTTWPGVWTNSCCGHPRPGESMLDAVQRRLDDELGMEVTDLVCVLPDYSYRAVDASGVVEHELCPVYTGRIPSRHGLHPKHMFGPNPDEVMDWKWVTWENLTVASRLTPFAFSPWAVEQVGLLAGAWLDQDRPEGA